MNMNFTRFPKVVLSALALLLAQALPAQVLINEYSCANLGQFPDDFGKHEDWIELYNADTAAFDLGGYFLSDNKDKPTKWPIPAGTLIAGKGYLVFWASGRDVASPAGLHTNFKLTQTKNNPETISLANPAGQVLSQVAINKTKLAQSRGSIVDGLASWGILTQPSPGASNNISPRFKGFADRPELSKPAGFYTDSVTVALINQEPGASLYYTLDGTEPGAGAIPYTGPITLKATAVFKAIAISPDTARLPSFVEYATYFVNDKHTLPVVSIAGMDLKTLANGEDTLRPHGSIEYFDRNGQRQTRTYGEFNSHGQDSWVNDQRSIDLVARDEMGYNNALNEKIFEYSDRDEFQRLILRAAGDDNYPGNFLPQHKGCAHLRDAYVHNLARRGGLNLDLRLSEKAIVYIDGEYWGVYDLREIPDDHDYTEYYYGQDKYNIQYILTWGDTWAQYGGNKALSDWKKLRSFILTRPMAVQTNFDSVANQLDVASLTDYVIVNSLTVCSDWLNYNTGWWRGLSPTGGHKKWGYILWDNDATFGYYINYTNIPDTTADADPCNVETLDGFSDPEWHIRVLNRLLANPGFKQYYVSRYIDLMNTVFSCDNMLSYLDTVANRIAPEMTRHAARWGGSYDDWQKNVDRLRDFISRRCQAVPAGLAGCYDLTGPYPVTFDADANAQLQINSLTVDQFPYTGEYYGGVDLKLAVQYDTTQGYRFERWLAGAQTFSPDDSTANVTLQLNGADTIVAHFEKVQSAVQAPASAQAAFGVQPTVFSSATTVTLDLPEAMPVALRLYAPSGREVAVLNDGQRIFTPGRYTLRLDLAGAGLPGGVYVLQCAAGAARQSLRIVYMP